MKLLDTDRALLLFSGGQDSTTCLYWALEEFKEVQTLTIDYGQRHKIEIDCAKKIAAEAKVPWRLLPLDLLKELGGNSLVDENQTITSDTGDDRLPLTFVPGRNLLFLSAAAALAYQNNCGSLITGVCQTDYSGYPDCREETIKALEKTLQLGMECNLQILTPLMFLTKAESITLAQKVGALEALKNSHTCYLGQQPPCGACDACLLRAKGFAEAGLPDPLLSQ
jgi:7-cyano-7-deazaguanine synthase